MGYLPLALWALHVLGNTNAVGGAVGGALGAGGCGPAAAAIARAVVQPPECITELTRKHLTYRALHKRHPRQPHLVRVRVRVGVGARVRVRVRG